MSNKTDDQALAAKELSKATGEPQSKFNPPEDVEYPDPDTLEWIDADEYYGSEE